MSEAAPSKVKTSPNTPQSHQQRGTASGRSSRYASRAGSPSNSTASASPAIMSSARPSTQAPLGSHVPARSTQPAQPAPPPAPHFVHPVTSTTPTPGPPPPVQAAVASAPPLAQPHDSHRPPVEFNHAISFVNRIKNRFTADPDIYKTFLEILQTYQKEQKAIQEVRTPFSINGIDNDFTNFFCQY